MAKQSGPNTATDVGDTPRRIPRLRSLVGKLMVALTLFVVLTTVALSLNNYRYVREMLHDSVEQQLTLQADGLREVLQAYIEQQQERAVLVASRTRLRALLRQFLDNEIGQSSFRGQTALILTDARDSMESFIQIRVADVDGRVITATDDAGIGQNVGDQPAFLLGLEQPTLGVPEQTTNGFQALLSAPARTNDGRLLGVVLVDVNVEGMREILDAIPSKFNSAQIRVATRQNDRIRYLFPVGGDVSSLEDLEVAFDEDPAMQQAIAGVAGFEAAVDAAGREVLVAYRGVGYRGWGLVTEVSAEEAYEAIAELSAAVILGGAVVAGLGLLVAIRVATRYTHPLLDLAQTAAKVRAGDLTVRASVSSHDEVGVMARSFNAMADALQKHQNQLEELVSKRTMVLQERTEQLQRSHNQLEELCQMLEEQAEVTARDLQRAEQIQRSLLPQQPPPMGDFCVQTLYRPGRNIGGDLYDVIGVGKRYLVLLIADASGHGVSAAMLAVLFKHRLRVTDRETGNPFRPAEALAYLNSALIPDMTTPGTFYTCSYCLLDTETRQLVVASAGHPPLLVFKHTGGIEQIEHTGPALGLFEEAEFEERVVSLEHGDSVLLYTDGLFDIGSDGTPDVRSIAGVLNTTSSRSRVLEKVLVAVSGGREREDRDDVTMLLLDASSGDSHFRDRTDSTELIVEAELKIPRVTAAQTADHSFYCIEGRVTWTFGKALLDAVMKLIDQGASIVIDFRECEYLDSTMLGTLHEVARRADAAGTDLRLQGVSEDIVGSFRELSMDAVLSHVSDHLEPVPRERIPLEIPETDLSTQRARLIKAHEELAGLSDANEEQFAGVVDSLREEIKSVAEP